MEIRFYGSSLERAVKFYIEKKLGLKVRDQPMMQEDEQGMYWVVADVEEKRVNEGVN